MPAYTLPPNAERVKILRALVKETLSREQIDRLSQDIDDAYITLDPKGATTEIEPAQIKRCTGYWRPLPAPPGTGVEVAAKERGPTGNPP
ncbi:hypothetical protein SHIRM173S_10469 [Streptomyces hirsutus]